ncbi:MAG TPA: hypothetical protein VFC23_08900 [Thermoanaerobaculia bacterium]|nr:hypothetical protein [Thermoanaerobaculia bacterium]
MSPWALAAAAILFLLLGLVGSRFARVLAAPADGALYRGVLYTLAGAVVLHLVLTLLDFAGVRWSLPVLGVALAVVAGAGALPFSLFSRRMGGRLGEEGRGDEGLGRGHPAAPGWGDALALFALAAFAVLALSGWIAMPDFVYHWGLKGHRFYLARGVDYRFLSRSWNWAIHPDYPNLVPETFATTALLAGGFDVPAMMLETAALFALLLAAVREGLRQGGADRFTRQAGTALVALSSAAFGIGYVMAGAADWNLALALAAAVPPLLRPPDRTGDLQIGVIAAFAAASKVEGVPLAAFLVAVQVVRRACTARRLDPAGALAAGLLPAAVVLPWLGRAAHHHLFQAFDSGAFDPARAGEIFAGVRESLRIPAWHGFLPAMFLPPLLLLSRRTRAFAAAATLELLFYFYAYFTSPVGSYRYFVLSNFPRLGFQLVPACLVAALVALAAVAAKRERPAGSSPPAARSARNDESAGVSAAG